MRRVRCSKGLILGFVIALGGCGSAGASGLGGYDAPWRHLKAGDVAYIGFDNWDSQSKRQTVCPSVDLVIESWEHSSSKGCVTIKHGTPVKIESVLPARVGTTTHGDPLTWLGGFARVRGVDRKSRGYTVLGFLQPNIPVGTVIPMVRDWSDGLPFTEKGTGKVVDLPDTTHVKVVEYHPESEGDTLLVQIVDGPYVGRRGWMAIQDADPPPGLDAGLYGIVDRGS